MARVHSEAPNRSGQAARPPSFRSEIVLLHHLNRISFAIVALGLLTLVAAGAGGLAPVWTLVGLMLVVAGIVKVAVVVLWRFVAQLDDPIHPEET